MTAMLETSKGSGGKGGRRDMPPPGPHLVGAGECHMAVWSKIHPFNLHVVIMQPTASGGQTQFG